MIDFLVFSKIILNKKWNKFFRQEGNGAQISDFELVIN